MPVFLSNVTTPLINNPNPAPDGSVQTPTVQTTLATGATQITAALLIGEITIIPNNTAANGVILPVGLRGQRLVVYPSLITAAPLVYPPIGGTINNGAVNAGLATPARLMRNLICLTADGLTWVSN